MQWRELMPPARGLKSHWFYILLSLAAEDRHGLAISRDVLALSDGQVKLWPATLYGSLDELATRGWIEELPENHARTQHESERKRFYLVPTFVPRDLLRSSH